MNRFAQKSVITTVLDKIKVIDTNHINKFEIWPKCICVQPSCCLTSATKEIGDGCTQTNVSANHRRHLKLIQTQYFGQCYLSICLLRNERQLIQVNIMPAKSELCLKTVSKKVRTLKYMENVKTQLQTFITTILYNFSSCFCHKTVFRATFTPDNMAKNSPS